MGKALAATAVALLVCLVAGMVYADYNQAYGTVKSIDIEGGKLVLSVRAGRDAEPEEMTLLINDDTTVLVNREKKTLEDVKADLRCNVTYKEADKEGGEGTALLINIMQARTGDGGGRGRGGNGNVN